MNEMDWTCAKCVCVGRVGGTAGMWSDVCFIEWSKWKR